MSEYLALLVGLVLYLFSLLAYMAHLIKEKPLYNVNSDKEVPKYDVVV